MRVELLIALGLLTLTGGEDALPPLDLGDVPSYATEAEAIVGCKPDAAIWADPNTGYFYPRWHKRYGRTQGGTFTCLLAAKRAQYWNINPFADDPERGREFPIDPSLLGPGV